MYTTATEILQHLTGCDDDDFWEEEFEECDDTHIAQEGVLSSDLPIAIRSKPRRNVPARIRHDGCALCLDQEQDLLEGACLLSLGCSHRVCSVCLSDYVKFHLSTTNIVEHTRSSLHKDQDALVLHIQEIIGVPCPCIDCSYVISTGVIRNYTDISTFEKFTQFALDGVVAKMRPTLPPCPLCGYILQEDCLCVNPDCRKVQLKARAREEFRRKRLEESERFLKQFILPGVKCCPKCFFEIEKDGGCDHMFCTRCSTHFSWEAAPVYGKNKAWFLEHKRKIHSQKKSK